MNYIEVTEDDLAKFIPIPTYRTRTRTYNIEGLYFDNEKKRFIRRIAHEKAWIEKYKNPVQQYLHVRIGERKMLPISYAELEKQYPEITGLYDPSRPLRIQKNKGASAQSHSDFDPSSVVDSFLESEWSSIF